MADEGLWRREYERLAELLRGAPGVPWTAPSGRAARLEAARELAREIAATVRRARDAAAQAAWTEALERARALATWAERGPRSDVAPRGES
jgi:hypothetical protein